LFWQLRDDLRQKSPQIAVQPDLSLLEDGPVMDEAVKGCDVLIAVVTKETERTAQRQHVELAKRTGKRVIVLRRPDAEVPVGLPYDDLIVLSPLATAFRELQWKLDSLAAPPGVGRPAGSPPAPAGLAPDPNGARPRGGHDAWASAAQEPAGRGPVRYVNEEDLPRLYGDQVRDRTVETERLERLLWNETVKVVVLWGQPGIGKTAMAVRLLRNLAYRPDPPVDWVGYLHGHGSRPLTSTTLLNHLNKVLQGAGRGLGALLEDPGTPSAPKLEGLLRQLDGTRVLITIDSLEALIDTDTREFREPGLAELLGKLAVGRWNPAVRLLLITRDRPERLPRGLRGGSATTPLQLDNGLPWPEADEFLRELDVDGDLGIATSPEDVRQRMHQLTGGFPRALEAVYAILMLDGGLSLDRLVEQMDAHSFPDAVQEFLVGEVLDRLGRWERRVTQALAIYGRPVRPQAVNYLLRPHEGSQYESTPELKRLLRLRLIREEGDEYHLPSPDRERVLNRIPLGGPKDRHAQPPRLNQMSLLQRAAGYFQKQRVNLATSVEDLSPRLTEIDLRLQAEDYEAAYKVIRAVDEHLSRWGLGHLLAGRRGALVGKLVKRNLELANLDALGNLNKQQGDLTEALLNFSHALRLAQEVGDPRYMTALHINLGTAYLEDGQLRWAATRYKMAVELAEQHTMAEAGAFALHGLSVCEGQRGHFLEALRYNTDVDQILGRLRATADPPKAQDLEPLEISQLLALGYWHGQLDDPGQALIHLRNGLRLATDQRLRADEARFKSACAEALLDLGEAEAATASASEAAVLAERIGNPLLLQPIWTTLAQTRLAAGELVAARAIVDDACRFRPTMRGLGAFALQGMIALLGGDKEDAHLAFRQTHEQASSFLRRDEPSFAMLDLDGMAQFGLVLCGEKDRLEDALADFRAARKITPHRGVIKHVLRMLDPLDRVSPPDLLDAARAAASGKG
jgi:tetratricopeptide (TPR) repeat protein